MSVGNTTKLPASSNGDNPNERQPLLVPSGPSLESVAQDPEEQRKIARPDELGWKSYTIYSILCLLGLLALTLLIKGFIDAGDVEVREPLSFLFRSRTK
jgi:hypothetical protein